MECPSLETLATYHADLLVAHDAEVVGHHVGSCARCRREMAALRNTQQVLEAMPAPAMPDDLWQGVAARIATKPHPASRTWLWRTAAGFGVAATLFVGVMLSQLGSPSLPVAHQASAAYVTEHQLLSTQDPLADRASLGVMLAADRGH